MRTNIVQSAAVTTALLDEVRAKSSRLDNRADLDPLLERIGDAHLVLLGEASHGTSDFYAWRHRISERLICEKGLSFIPRTSPMFDERGHRAIGVVYHPRFEHYGNYVPTVLPPRYDAMLYIDESHALHPLHMPAVSEHEVPETYPTGV